MFWQRDGLGEFRIWQRTCSITHKPKSFVFIISLSTFFDSCSSDLTFVFDASCFYFLVFVCEIHTSLFLHISSAHTHTHERTFIFDYIAREYYKQPNRTKKLSLRHIWCGEKFSFENKTHTKKMVYVKEGDTSWVFAMQNGDTHSILPIIDAIMTFALTEWRILHAKKIFGYTALSILFVVCRGKLLLQPKFIILLVKLDAICLKVESKAFLFASLFYFMAKSAPSSSHGFNETVG